jgi:hypothetical protein
MTQITIRKTGPLHASRSDPIGLDPVDFRTLAGKKLDGNGKILDKSGKILDTSHPKSSASH